MNETTVTDEKLTNCTKKRTLLYLNECIKIRAMKIRNFLILSSKKSQPLFSQARY